MIVISFVTLLILPGTTFAAEMRGRVEYITNKFKTLVVVDAKTHKKEIFKFNKKTPTLKPNDIVTVTYKAGKSGKGIVRANSIVRLAEDGGISPAEFKKLQDAGALIIDVRSAREAKKKGMITTAINIPLNQLEKKMGSISKSKKAVVYCNSGTIAAIAYTMLKNNGYNNVSYLSAKVKFTKGVVKQIQ